MPRPVQLSVAGGARTGKAPAAADTVASRRRLEVAVGRLQPTLFGLWPAFDSAGEVIASVAFTGVVYGSQRTDVDGAVGIQSAVSLVRGPEHGG